jgi:pimeloyl-ACP methyl ester carboxylesterase
MEPDFTPASEAPDVDRWPGAALLAGGKGYAPTPMGQVHYRDLGPKDGSVPMVLLHMTPLSMVQYAEAQTRIASMGIRVIALDTPGYGLSDPPPPDQVTIAAFADNLIAVLDHLNIDRALFAGHHTGSCIAASFAARHPNRVAAVILHGVPIFNAEEIAVRINRPLGDRTPRDDGGHLNQYFDHNFVPNQERTPAYLKAQTWFSLCIFLEGPDVGHHAVYRYDMVPDLLALRMPGLIITDRGDAMHSIDQRAAKLRPDFLYREFSDDGTLSIMMHPHEWARVTTEFHRHITASPRRP